MIYNEFNFYNSLNIYKSVSLGRNHIPDKEQ